MAHTPHELRVAGGQRCERKNIKRSRVAQIFSSCAGTWICRKVIVASFAEEFEILTLIFCPCCGLGLRGSLRLCLRGLRRDLRHGLHG